MKADDFSEPGPKKKLDSMSDLVFYPIMAIAIVIGSVIEAIDNAQKWLRFGATKPVEPKVSINALPDNEKLKYLEDNPNHSVTFEW